MKSLRSDTLTMRVTGVRIAMFRCAIVIDVTVHCYPTGVPFESNGRKQFSLSSCGWVLIRLGQFKITLVAELGIQPSLRSFWTETSAITFSTFSIAVTVFLRPPTVATGACVLMALASLRFQRNAQDYEETRQGMTVFAGDAASFHEWQFHLQIKKSLCKAEELPALTAKVVDALRGEALSCAMEIGLAKLMESNGLDLLVQKVQERLFPQRTAEARELLKQGMSIGGPMSRVPGEPMTSYISRRRRWWTLVHEMDNRLELGDTVQGSMMLEQAGLSRFEQNMVLTYTKGQRTMTAIAEALLEQHYDVHHRGRETPTPTGNSSSPNRWRRRDTTRAYLAEAEPIKELTDTAANGEEGISDDYDGEQDEEEDDKIHETDFAALLGNSGEDPEADDALAEALQLDVLAMVAWQRFNGKGKGKSKGKGKVKGKGKGKGKNKGNNLSLEERKKRLAELKSRTNCQACGARGHWAGDDICPKNAKTESTLQSPARAYLTIGGPNVRFRSRLDR